jgi:hypothetical protein
MVLANLLTNTSSNLPPRVNMKHGNNMVVLTKEIKTIFDLCELKFLH